MARPSIRGRVTVETRPDIKRCLRPRLRFDTDLGSTVCIGGCEHGTQVRRFPPKSFCPMRKNADHQSKSSSGKDARAASTSIRSSES